MSLHKLTAGDGYSYLTRQVAAHDATERGYRSLGDYYAQRGEAPGRWMGSGLVSLGVSGVVTEAQMRALFGEGRHPDADAIELAVVENSGTPAQALKASTLGRPFPAFDAEPSEYRRLVAERVAEWNADGGLPRDWPVPAESCGTRSRTVGSVAR
jgi:TrwC relaxase